MSTSPSHSKISIFLASSNEMKEDRNNIERLIRSKNDEWQKLGRPYIDLEIWEDESEAMSSTRSQDEYNKIIPTVDIFIMLFWHKVGKFTKEEFLVAKELFLETKSPLVFVYKKASPKEELEQSAKDFEKKLFKEDEEYFCGNYEHFDTLALKLHKEIDGFYVKYYQENKQNRNYNLGNVNKLLMNFSDENLKILTMIHFEKVYQNFTSGQSKQERVMKLIGYAREYLEMDTLLASAEEQNKQAFEQYQPYF